MHFEYNNLELAKKLEQITDDFTIKLMVWMVNIKPNNENLKHIDYEKGDEYVATELLTYFKENVYNK